ncbi:MAG: hypothetical protein IKV75_00670 [Bacteroidales bacterium]|nr:hypothetical protein [Bacteroidales bacterium]
MNRIALLILAALMLTSCGASRKVVQKPVQTYVQPGSDLLKAPNTIRAWAMGESTSEMTARKKAVVSASSELAMILNAVVASTVESYCLESSHNDETVTRDYFSSKTAIAAKTALVGARVVYDHWEPENAQGMYSCYVVLEITADDFMKTLMESMADAQSKKVKVDEELLREHLLKSINASK